MNFTNNHRIILLYFTVFILISLITVFLPVWLHQYGKLSEDEIGILIGSAGLIKIFSNYYMTRSITNINEKKIVTIFIVLLVIGIFFFFYFEKLEGWRISLFSFFFLALFAPVLPLVENISTTLNKKFYSTYGKLRLSGSIAFSVTVIIFGLFIDKYSSKYFPLIFICFLFCFLFSVFLVPENESKLPYVEKSNIKKLLKDSQYIIILMSCSLVLASHAMYYYFSAIYWTNSKMNFFQVGLLWGVGVLAEIIFFLVIDKIKIKKYFFQAFYLIGMIATIRWIATFIINNFFLLMFIQTFHAITFGLTHYLVIFYIYSKVDENNKLIAQAIYHAISSGVLMTILTILAGNSFKYDIEGIGFLFMAVFSFLSVIIIFLKGIIFKHGIK